ncbi:unnamed protein product [Gadus morhua 'NCC']
MQHKKYFNATTSTTLFRPPIHIISAEEESTATTIRTISATVYLDLVSFPSISPSRTASASSSVVSVAAPKNRDVSSRSCSLSRTLDPRRYRSGSCAGRLHTQWNLPPKSMYRSSFTTWKILPTTTLSLAGPIWMSGECRSSEAKEDSSLVQLVLLEPGWSLCWMSVCCSNAAAKPLFGLLAAGSPLFSPSDPPGCSVL